MDRRRAPSLRTNVGGLILGTVEGEEASQDLESLERLFMAARSPHVRERHAEGQSPNWLPAAQQVQHAAHRVRRHPEAAAWLIRALKDQQRKWFAAQVTAALGTPEPFLEEMLRAAIDEPNPSFNRRFVEPCVHAFGAGVVRERLRRAVETGSDHDVAGAARAYYWTFAIRPQPMARTRSDWLRNQEVFLRAFLQTDSLDARRSLLPRIKLAKLAGEPELEDLAQQVISLARASRDDYLVRRVAVQLGEESVFPALPPLSGDRR
jgi:hypothetical protein